MKMSTKNELKPDKKGPQILNSQQKRNQSVKKTNTKTNPLSNSNNLQRAQSNKTNTINNNVVPKISPGKINRNQVSANWNSLASTIKPQKTFSPENKIGYLSKTSVIALDCEMVGIGPNGRDHMLARVSIVNEKGEIILDKYVKPTEPVVDYRTRYSGITPMHLEQAHTFAEVQAEVTRIKYNRILVGHALHNDFRVLKLEHPKRLLRDTSVYKKCREISDGTTPALRLLTNCILKYDIQTGSHCSIEDARATMAIYQQFAKNWERSMAKYL